MKSDKYVWVDGPSVPYGYYTVLIRIGTELVYRMTHDTKQAATQDAKYQRGLK